MTATARELRAAAAVSSRRVVVAAVGLLCGAALCVVALTGETRAAFTDDEHAAGALTARVLLPPVPNDCDAGFAGQGITVTVRWTAPVSQPGFSYEVRAATLNTLIASGDLAGTATSFQFGRPLALGSTYVWRVWSTVPGSTWTSAERTGSVTRHGSITFGYTGCSWD